MHDWLRTIRRHAPGLIALLVLVLACNSLAVACPTCKDGMTNDANRAGLIRGYFWSILFMMSMPFLIVVGLSTYFYFEVRRARARQQQPKSFATPAIASK